MFGVPIHQHGEMYQLALIPDGMPLELQQVGLKLPNQWGLFDIHGNVWEWVWDWSTTYPSTAQTNPTGAASGTYRVRRGGSWDYAEDSTRSAFRSTRLPADRYNDLGFRLVRP